MRPAISGQARATWARTLSGAPDAGSQTATDRPLARKAVTQPDPISPDPITATRPIRSSPRQSFAPALISIALEDRLFLVRERAGRGSIVVRQHRHRFIGDRQLENLVELGLELLVD